MSRAERRVCKRQGHVPKTDGESNLWCARCGAALPDEQPALKATPPTPPTQNVNPVDPDVVH